MPEIFEVANVQDAVELAQTLKAEGRFNWFRGQVQDWPPLSSLLRHFVTGGAEFEMVVKDRYDYFWHWLQENPALSRLATEDLVHECFAIAQHYGFPTHYIDFTTDPGVAGFFAADCRNPPHSGQSCIYCLNTEELSQFLKSIKPFRKGANIELIEVSVDNLWRLQAQRGVFVYANYNWDIDFPLDKIIFPYTGYPSYPSTNEIYPKEKSFLELQLELYFDLERKREAEKYAQKMVHDLKASGKSSELLRLESFPDGVFSEISNIPDGVDVLSSWKNEENSIWFLPPSEHFNELAGLTQRLHLNSTTLSAVERAIEFGVKQILDKTPAIRGSLVDWQIYGTTGDLPLEKISVYFREAWNGMRNLPYSNGQIAAAFATIAALAVVDFNDFAGSNVATERFNAARGDGFRVEFAYGDYSSSRGFVRKELVRSAMRADIKTRLKPELNDVVDEVVPVFHYIQNPTRLFEFLPFVDMFACDVIPSQIVLRRAPTLFNAAALEIFGLP